MRPVNSRHRMKADIVADMERLNTMAVDAKPLTWARRLGLYLRPEILALALYRHAHYHYLSERWSLATFFYRLNLLVTGADIHPRSTIGPGCVLVHTIGFIFDGSIGKNATIFGHCIVQPAFRNGSWSESPVLGDNCTLCLQSSVIRNISVANSVTLAAFVYLDHSVHESDTTVGLSQTPQTKIYTRKI